MFNIDAGRLAATSGRKGRDTGERAAGSARRTRQLGLAFLAAAALCALVAALTDNRFAALGAVLFTVLFIGRRSLARVARFLAVGLLPYQLIWMAFIAARGIGDEVSWVDRVRLWPRQMDVWLFGGEMPTTVLQRLLFDPNRLMPYDYFFTALHVSFFVVPFMCAMLLCYQVPARGRRFLVALALLFTMGVPGFFLLPGNPPWMNPAAGDPNPAPAYRVNAAVAHDLGIEAFEPDGRLTVEENSLAVIPSIHMGVSFLLALSAPLGGRRWRRLTRLYAALMAVSLVYLGEHQVVDEILGIVLAVLAWQLAPAIQAHLGRAMKPVANATRTAAAGAVARFGSRLRREEDGATVEGEPAR